MVLPAFHPAVAAWFGGNFPRPTAPQTPASPPCAGALTALPAMPCVRAVSWSTSCPCISVRVDPKARRAYVEPGATLGDLDREAQAFALATPLGVNVTTGYKPVWLELGIVSAGSG